MTGYEEERERGFSLRIDIFRFQEEMKGKGMRRHVLKDRSKTDGSENFLGKRRREIRTEREKGETEREKGIGEWKKTIWQVSHIQFSLTPHFLVKLTIFVSKRGRKKKGSVCLISSSTERIHFPSP